jgi:adenylate cyclase
MGTEIERKFLVKGDGWRGGAGVLYRQGYLSRAPRCTVRARVAGGKAFLTVKGESTGAVRSEFEYPIPVADAEEMLATLSDGPVIEKHRYRIPQGELVWEVDEFLGANFGLVVAEIELPAADHPFEKPAWVGQEVTGDVRYYNSTLAQHPYTKW